MAKKPSTVRPFLALTRITSDGDVYERGDQIDLTDRQARQLLEAGAVKPFLVPAPTLASVSPSTQSQPTPSAPIIAPQGFEPQGDQSAEVGEAE